MTTTKPGYTTTEFWTTVGLHILTAVVTIASLFGHNLDGSQLQPLVGVAALIASGIAQAYYSRSRGAVKASSGY